MNREKCVLLLCTEGDSTRAVYHALNKEFDKVVVLRENKISRAELIKRRIKRLGLVKTAGQLTFMTLIVPKLRRSSSERIDEIRREYNLDDADIDGEMIRVESVNSEAAREKIREIKPDVIVVNGTRIIGKKTLQSSDAPFINMHAGITPTYRGVHGAYWALFEGKRDLTGTTVHFVDEGVDTGTVIKQVCFPVTKRDNFVTYPYLHTGAGIPALIEAVRAALNGERNAQKSISDFPSKLRYHPTVWEYLAGRKRGVK